MPGDQQVPTRSAVLQLRDEETIIKEAYEFLDEKRLLLAAELLRRLNRYEQLLADYEELRQSAEQALIAVIRRHGLQGAEVYPTHYCEDCRLVTTKKSFMGVTIMTSEMGLPDDISTAKVSYPSPEAQHCRDLFLELTKLAAIMATISGNLYRLLGEYRRTERRARALENVVIPEVGQVLRTMSSQLEELEQEDIIRIHLNHK
jgi:V/A-type H+-transporting ATPase subunit D